MLSSDIIRQLKQTDISVDSEKTAQRVEALWKSAKNAEKRAVTELAGIGSATIYRVYNTGHISAKLDLALAQVLGVDPFYLSAEADEPGAFNEDNLKEFLTAHGYDTLAQGLEPKKRRSGPRAKRATNEVTAESEPEDTKKPEAAFEPEIEIIEIFEEASPEPEFAGDLEDDDILILVHSLRLRATCGVAEASVGLKKLYSILLS